MLCIQYEDSLLLHRARFYDLRYALRTCMRAGGIPRTPRAPHMVCMAYAGSASMACIINVMLRKVPLFWLCRASIRCMSAGKQKACIYVYGYMGKYEEAVELSLEIGRQG